MILSAGVLAEVEGSGRIEIEPKFAKGAWQSLRVFIDLPRFFSLQDYLAAKKRKMHKKELRIEWKARLVSL